MRVSRRARAARWGGAALVALAPLPWLGVGTAVAEGAPGNNGTLKVHEQGTPSGFEDNDPKVCVFNFEGFSFDSGQTGYITITGQGQSTGTYGPIDFGPADAAGFYATSYVNDGGLAVPDGHYKATLFGKGSPDGGQVEEKAKSKVFKVICDTPPTSESETPTSESETPTSESETPTSESETPTSESETPTSETPVTIITTESSSPASPANNQTSKTPELRSPEVEATRLTQPAVLPKTGPDLPIGAALAASLLFIGLGVLLLLGPGRLAPERYFRKH